MRDWAGTVNGYEIDPVNYFGFVLISLAEKPAGEYVFLSKQHPDYPEIYTAMMGSLANQSKATGIHFYVDTSDEYNKIMAKNGSPTVRQAFTDQVVVVGFRYPIQLP